MQLLRLAMAENAVVEVSDAFGFGSCLLDQALAKCLILGCFFMQHGFGA